MNREVQLPGCIVVQLDLKKKKKGKKKKCCEKYKRKGAPCKSCPRSLA